MNFFLNKHGSITPLTEKPFVLERDIQNLCEQNLSVMSDLVFVKSEFKIKNRRIDTLAFDVENRSFVIIEYKRDKNYSVIDQGLPYLNLMLEYRDSFIIEYNESLTQNLKRNEVDWSLSKVIFVAPSFTDDQKQSTNFKDLAIELWEIKRFSDGLIFVNPIKKSKAAPSIKELKPSTANSDELDNVIQISKVYHEDDHLEAKSDNVIELYQEFKLAILNLADDIEVKATKIYIGFKKKKLLCSIVIQKNALKLWINAKHGDIKDEKQLSRDVSNVGHHGPGDYELTIKDTKNKEYIMSLIKQVIDY